MEGFLVFDLSRKYIQIIRERADETYKTLNEIKIGLLKLYAPILPFITEKIWQNLRENKIVKEESIYLCDWPKYDNKKINEELEKNFDMAFEIIERGLAERDKVQIGLKWPLAKAVVYYTKELGKKIEEIIARQLNVKKIEWKKAKEKEWRVELDSATTPELEAEGYAREFARNVQAARKREGLEKGDILNLKVATDKGLRAMLEANKKFLLERTNSKSIEFTDDISGKTSEFEIKGKKVTIIFCNL